MWINVRAVDAADDLIWESGAYDAVTGVLTEDAQAKVYEVKLGVWDFNGTGSCDVADSMGDPIFHFVLNNCIKQDNRIPPLGFTGGSSIEMRPVAYTYPETSPGSGVGFDTHRSDGSWCGWSSTCFSVSRCDGGFRSEVIRAGRPWRPWSLLPVRSDRRG